jgi:hypothetical protein
VDEAIREGSDGILYIRLGPKNIILAEHSHTDLSRCCAALEFIMICSAGPQSQKQTGQYGTGFTAQPGRDTDRLCIYHISTDTALEIL